MIAMAYALLATMQPMATGADEFAAYRECMTRAEGEARRGWPFPEQYETILRGSCPSDHLEAIDDAGWRHNVAYMDFLDRDRQFKAYASDFVSLHTRLSPSDLGRSAQLQAFMACLERAYQAAPKPIHSANEIPRTLAAFDGVCAAEEQDYFDSRWESDLTAMGGREDLARAGIERDVADHRASLRRRLDAWVADYRKVF